MSLNGTRNYLARGLVSLVLLSSSTGMVGCQNNGKLENKAQGWALLSMVAGGNVANAKNLRQANALNSISQGTGLLAQIEGQRQAAEAAKSEVNQNVYVQPQNLQNQQNVYAQPPIEQILSYAYNYVKDDNHDGRHNFPEEIVGLKNRFMENEPISITFLLGRQYDNLNYKLVDDFGNTFEELNNLGTMFSFTTWYNPSQSNIEKFKKEGGLRKYPDKFLGALKPGTYKGVVYSNNELLAWREVTIVPNPELKKQNEITAISFNHWEDINRNGSIDLPELIGFNKDTFFEKEKIILCFYNPLGEPLGNYDYKLIDCEGKLVYEDKSFLEKRNGAYTMSYFPPNYSPDNNLENKGKTINCVLKPGTYKGLFYSENSLPVAKEFTIVANPEIKDK